MFAIIEDNTILFTTEQKVKVSKKQKRIEYAPIDGMFPYYENGTIVQKLPQEQINKEIFIGKKILEEIYWNNLSSQFYDLVQTQVKIIAILIWILWKSKVTEIFSEEIQKVKSVSEIRQRYGMTPVDLSFLD